MSKRDLQVDAYIGRAAEFARPVLVHLRRLVHGACGEVEETMKWGMPSFLYRGKILCGMAAFKRHCAFGFWYSSRRGEKVGEAMGELGRIVSVEDLPTVKVLEKGVKQAMKLIGKGVVVRKPKKERVVIRMPADLAAALKKNKRAAAAYQGFSYSDRKEYVQWITEAKREETRKRRVETAVKWMAEGKGRNWKYESR